MESDLGCEGNVHQQLLICVAAELGLRAEAVSPGLLYDLGARARLAFVQGKNRGEVDLFVDVVLDGGGEVIGMVMRSAFGVIVAMVIVFVVAVRHVDLL